MRILFISAGGSGHLEPLIPITRAMVVIPMGTN
jgi:UDP:flavonoid glycosyltransferase YjiC (YdhE family)